MCGIAGLLLNSTSEKPFDLIRVTEEMSGKIAHRGPDGQGVWAAPQAQVSLAQRRLAIVDLSPTGLQPMTSICGRFVISFNGEVYNHADLRSQLGEVPFRGTSDTEVLLELISRRGLRVALERVVGMFAFALYDMSERKLFLARDRCGEKPLYVLRQPWGFAFASEISAFSAIPTWKPSVDKTAVEDYLRTGCIPAPRTIFDSVSKLMPGTVVEYSQQSDGWQSSTPVQYWKPSFMRPSGERSPRRTESLATLADGLEHLLRDAVASQMVADVPVGSFLSGGIDSSLVTSIMQSISPGRVETFTIGFHGNQEYDESSFAQRIAQHLGTRHYTRHVTESDLLSLVSELPTIYSEPFADASQIPTILLARFARERVKVALSGDGADELFGGYNRHIQISRLEALRSWVPASVMKRLADSLDGQDAKGNNKGSKLLALMTIFGQRQAADKLHKVAGAMSGATTLDTYMSLVSSDGSAINGWKENFERVYADTLESPTLSFMHADFLGYLHDDVLTKVDRATMSAGLESRAPFLDHRIVDFAHSLGESACISRGQGKIILRMLLEKHVPKELFDRPKQGFAVPMSDWLRGPLRDWAEDLISSQDLIDRDTLKSRWDAHQELRRNWKDWLWPVLTLLSWHRHHLRLQ